MNDRAKVIDECLDKCTQIARNSSSSASTGAWSCVRELRRMFLDANTKQNKHIGSSLDSFYEELGELDDVKKLTNERLAELDREK